MKLDVPQKEVCSIDTSILDSILSAIVEDDWNVLDYRKGMNAGKNTNSILIRHSSDYTISGMENMPLYDKYFPLIEPVLDLLKQHYTYNEYAAFITRLHPHTAVKVHKDWSDFLEKCNRLHVPLQTNENVLYHVDGADYCWKKGVIYEFDNTRDHGVKNESDDQRIHLIVNLYDL
jgi:hypothetical protein